MADRQPHKGRAEPASTITVLAEHSSKSAIDRADELARAQCTDAEIAAALVDEIPGGDPEAIRGMLADPQIAARLEEKRVAGRASLKAHLYQIGTTDQPTAATLQVTTWLSRQHLGHSTNGLSEDLAKALDDLDGKSGAEVAAYLRKVADAL